MTLENLLGLADVLLMLDGRLNIWGRVCRRDDGGFGGPDLGQKSIKTALIRRDETNGRFVCRSEHFHQSFLRQLRVALALQYVN